MHTNRVVVVLFLVHRAALVSGSQKISVDSPILIPFLKVQMERNSFRRQLASSEQTSEYRFERYKEERWQYKLLLKEYRRLQKKSNELCDKARYEGFCSGRALGREKPENDDVAVQTDGSVQQVIENLAAENKKLEKKLERYSIYCKYFLQERREYEAILDSLSSEDLQKILKQEKEKTEKLEGRLHAQIML